VLHFQAELVSVGMSGTYEPQGHDDAELVVLRHDFARQLVLASYCEGGPWCTCPKGCLSIERVFHETSVDGIPTSLLERASSFEIPSNGTDRQPIDLWGRMLILDSGRARLP